LSCRLARGIHIKENEATPLSIPQTANALRRPPVCKTVLFKESAEGFQAGAIHISQETTRDGTDEEGVCVQTAPETPFCA
jgi:hypothetical protein